MDLGILRKKLFNTSLSRISVKSVGRISIHKRKKERACIHFGLFFSFRAHAKYPPPFQFSRPLSLTPFSPQPPKLNESIVKFGF